LTSYRIRRNGHILRTDKDKMPKKVPNTKLNGKCPTKRLDQNGNKRSGKMSHKTMGRNRTGKSLERQSSFIVR
jgi:hypothetical protein